MTQLRAIGNIPNTTSLLGNSVASERPAELVRADREELGQRRERQHPPQHARQILTGKLTVKQAAQSASDNISPSSTHEGEATDHAEPRPASRQRPSPPSPW